MALKIEKHARRLGGLYELVSIPYTDHRGFMSRIYDDKVFEELGLNTTWVQESRCYYAKKNIVKGFHASLEPMLEGKSVTPMRGEILWVVVDVRKNSPSFGQWESVHLSAAKMNTLYAERGFAHGSISLTDDVELLLRADNYYSEDTGTGILWCDSELNVEWPLDGSEPIILERDRHYPTFREFREKHGGVIL